MNHDHYLHKGRHIGRHMGLNYHEITVTKNKKGLYGTSTEPNLA